VPDSEDTLIRRAQEFDTEAFSLLAKGYERRIYSLAFHFCHNPQDAEDLSQEVWLKAFRSLAGFRGDSSFYTWLRAITINCFLNHQRSRRSRAIESLPDTIESEAIAVDSELTLHNRILAGRVMQALSELTAAQRLVFLLKHHEGMTYEEIGKAVGCSPGTAKKSVHRALRKLRERLEVNAEPQNTFRGMEAKVEMGV
jgi:RNA polymerase sigma-70 factor (ECF subfamily)